MKKVLSIVFIFVFVTLLTGCGSSNKVTCVFDGTSDKRIAKETIVAELDSDDKVVKLSDTMEYDKTEDAEADYEFMKDIFKDSVKISGNTIELKDMEKNSEYNLIIGMTKEEFINFMIKTDPEVSCK